MRLFRRRAPTLFLAIVAPASTFNAAMTWASIGKEAGAVPSRLLDETHRLFNAAEPHVIFWRDAAAWCPFCEMTWLLLEQMRVPYQVKTVPLRQYMLPGDQKDPSYLAMVGPDGVVPGVQFLDDDGKTFGPAVQSVERIFDELEQRFPEAFPSGPNPTVRARACEGEMSIFGRLRVARRSYEACAGAADGPGAAALGPPLSGALQDLDALLAGVERDMEGSVGGGWIGGAQPSVADLMLLPFLERTAAVVPYFFGTRVLASRADVPFARAARYLERARASSDVYAELCSDSTTLARTNCRYAQAGAAPRYSVPLIAVDRAAAAAIDGTSAATRNRWAAEATEVAKREAAARLASKPERVVAFARRCSLPHGDDAVDGDAATKAALRAVGTLLVDPTTSDASAPTSATILQRDAEVAADALRETYSADALASAAAALDALSLNVGVPRDMATGAACALRSHCRLVSAALREVGFNEAAARLRRLGSTRDNVLVIIDFDLTLTTGTSDECHDIVGESPLMPPALRSAFEPLLDFSKPFPPELEGDRWWARANALIIEHGAEISASTFRAVCDAAPVELRPGANELLCRLRELGVPVLIVSAGVSDVIEAVLDASGVPRGDETLLAVSSNKLIFGFAQGEREGGGAGEGEGEGAVVGVEPAQPITSLNKGMTFERNRQWLEQLHASRTTLLVVGDRISDLKVAAGAPEGYEAVGIGIFNDTPHGAQPAFEDFAAQFDCTVRGDEGSLDALRELVEGLGDVSA